MSPAGRSAIIKGTGSYVPAKALGNSDLAKIVDTSHEWIHARTGICERRIASNSETSASMGATAARRAAEDAGVALEDIDLVLVATITPDMPFPSTACLIQAELGIGSAVCMDIEAACSGFLYALEAATGMLQTGRYRNALVIGSEKLSSILDWEDRSTCVLFGDGAGAAILSLGGSQDGHLVADFHLGSDGNKGDVLNMPGGGSAIPATVESVQQRQHFLKMRGKEVFKLAVKVMGQAAAEILKDNEVSPSELGCVIPHQANLRIIDAIATRLEIPIERFYLNLDKYGNTSAASIPIALDEAARAGRLAEGQYVLLVAFGAGLTWGSTLLKW